MILPSPILFLSFLVCEFQICNIHIFIHSLMSDLLINWLNDEVQLSRRITNFEEDFHNGYLFGELLSKYSQQLNFGEFVNKDDKASRIKNFTLLYDTFKTLRVGFDSNIAMNVIEKKTGIAKKVLYELKMQLEKTNSNAFSKLNKSSKPLSPLKKIPLSKDTFDKISKEHFNKQLNQIHRAQKNINLDSHLQKFPDFHQKQLQRAEVEERKETQSTLLKQMKFRERQLDNLKKSQQFRQDWEQSNLEKWAANVSIRKIQNQKDFSYRNKLETTKVQNKTMSELNAIKALDDDIKKFEKKVLPKKPRDDSDSEQQPEEQVPTQPQPRIMKRSNSQLRSSEFSGFNKTIDNRSKLSLTMEGNEAMKKKSPQEVQISRHQREKRRRKMIVEQGKKHHLIKIERREKYILNTLEQNSKQEKEIQYQIWRAWQNKQIIIQNRQAYDQKVKEKEETRTINAKFKDDELVKTFRQEHQQELKNAIERQNKLKVDDSVRQRKEVYSECKSIVESFISMTEVLFEFGQQKNVEEIDEIFLNHLLDEFVESASNKKQIAEIQLKNYIQGKGQWRMQLTKDSQEQSTEPTEENSLPLSVVNNYYLGNILKTVFSQLYKSQKTQQPKESRCKNLVALLGLEFAGKKQLAQQIKDQYQFNIISINELIEGKLKDFGEMQARGIQIDGETADLVEACFNGKQIPNNIIISLLKAETEKHQKCLLVNYPLTYQECVEFTQAFGNVGPSDYSKKQKLAIKIEDFSRLVWPTQTKYIPRSLQPCGLDFALWMEISPRTSLDRFLGRKWTPEGECLHINKEIINPNTLIVGEKASSAIVKNSFKINNKNKLKSWFSQFGIRVTENEEQKVQLCWEEISGQGTIQDVSHHAFNLFNKALDLKNKKNSELKLKELELKQEAKKKEDREIFEQQLKEKCALSTPEQIQQKFQEALDSRKVGDNFLQNIQQIWNTTQKMTVTALCNIFQILRDQDQSKNKYISSTKRNFIRLLTREDERFYLVKKFQNDYNKFFEENQDMVGQDYTKEELHQRIEDLETDLLTLIEDKKEDAVNERENIKNSGWLEGQLEQIVGAAHVMLQTQLNRTFACQQIISDFYSKKFMVSTGQIAEGQQELPIDPSLQLYKDGASPRLEKLLSQAMRLFNKEEEVVDDKNKKGGKPPPKKDDKKQAKKGGKEEVQENKEPTPEELEFKKALNTQKAIFRYRVKVISGYASKRLSEFNTAGIKLYEDLQDLYRYTDKIENKAVIEMTKIFKQAIEEQRKIQNQVQINYTEVLENHLIRNFQKPKPVILPAAEKVQSNRFTISSMIEIMKFFANESEVGTTIKTRRLISIFEELLVNERYRILLPDTWRNLTIEQLQNFIGKFDKAGKGEIQLWILYSVVALTNIPLPTDKNLEQFRLLATGHNPTIKQVSKEALVKAEAWFDSKQPQEENVRTFQRNKHLKEILFNIFKKSQEEQEVNLDQMCRKLKLSDFRTGQEENITYFDFAFPV